MADVLTYEGRLPGVVVQIAPPAPAPAPLRLDVAGLVGFAQRGPLDLPVLVEDPHQFELIFGGDLPVAREGGRPIYAHLPRAVRAFFENGGRRCYVVRVAGDSAAANQFPIPGLFTGEPGTGGFAPVVRPAAWEGGWSDSVRVGTQLLSDPQRIASGDPFQLLEDEERGTDDLAGFELNLLVQSRDTVRKGDVLRLHFRDVQLEGRQLGDMQFFAQVTGKAIRNGGQTLHDIPVTIRASIDRMAAFQVLNSAPDGLPISVAHTDGRARPELDADPLPYAGDEDGFALNMPSEADVVAGDLLRLSYADATVIYFPVSEVLRIVAGASEDDGDGENDDGGNGDSARLRSDQALRVIALERDTLEEMLGVSPVAWETLDEALSQTLVQADLLTFDLHVREGGDTLEVWHELRFNGSGTAPTRCWLDQLARPVDREILSSTAERLQQRSLRLGAGEPPTGGQPFFLPLGMGQLRPQWRGPLLRTSDGNGCETGDLRGKDGLDAFKPEPLFLDEAFEGARLGRIMTVLEGLLYLGPERIRPTGMHSLLGLDEVALIALPDLAHRPWTEPQPPARYEPPEGPSEEKRDRTRFWDCSLLAEEGRDEEENEGQPGEDEAAELYHLPVLEPPEAYDPDAMLAVQEALVAMCAASSDRVAILTLPLHFDRRETLTWQQQLSARFQGYSERPLSYAAAYHGWVRVRETTTPELAPLRDVPPHAAVCGMIAARELARGPWIAAANLALQGIVGLKPTLSEEDKIALFNGRINVVAQRPGRFVSLSAHTLSPDRLLFQLSVRRLLIYLREVLLREGNRWVFETNNARFRQRVQSRLERVLAQLVERGGLAAFEVVTGSEVNTPKDYDQGRFIVAVKIAPTQPIEFITVVLLRTGEGQLETVER